jgi:hypothetical protein
MPLRRTDGKGGFARSQPNARQHRGCRHGDILATNFARLMTGDTVYIDKGYHVVSSRQWFGLPYRAA